MRQFVKKNIPNFKKKLPSDSDCETILNLPLRYQQILPVFPQLQTRFCRDFDAGTDRNYSKLVPESVSKQMSSKILKTQYSTILSSWRFCQNWSIFANSFVYIVPTVHLYMVMCIVRNEQGRSMVPLKRGGDIRRFCTQLYQKGGGKMIEFWTSNLHLITLNITSSKKKS